MPQLTNTWHEISMMRTRVKKMKAITQKLRAPAKYRQLHKVHSVSNVQYFKYYQVDKTRRADDCADGKTKRSKSAKK